MSFIEARLDDRISYGFQAVPGYDTEIVLLANGREKRNAKRTKAKRRYTAEFTTFDEAQFAGLANVFHACLGSAHSFRFKDWTDYKVTGGSLGVAPSGSTAVQLVKVYTSGALTTTRTIVKPNSLRFVLYQAGIAKAGTLDTTTGLFTPSTAWTAAAALTADFEFDVAVRFAADELPSTYETYRVIKSAIELVEDFL